MSASRVPVQRSHAEPPGRECIQVQPSPPNHRGRKNAVRPSDWSSTSLSHAPNRPIQLWMAWGPVSPEAVFSDGSVACQVASERRRRSETRASSTPRNTFSGRLRVGDRTMETGFMAFALPLLGPLRNLPRASQRSGRRVPEQPLLSGREWGIPGRKQAGGTLVWTPI